jgi:hypothetical protein
LDGSRDCEQFFGVLRGTEAGFDCFSITSEFAFGAKPTAQNPDQGLEPPECGDEMSE